MPRAETCSRCDQEVRYGYRDGWGWFHREDVDHNPLFGKSTPSETWARIKAQIAERVNEKTTKVKGESDNDIPDADEEEDIFVPHVEVPWIVCELEEMPGGAQNVAKAATKHGWDTALWYARAHWKGKVISDMHRVEVAKGQTKAVAWWRDGKFESAIVNGTTGRVKSPELNKIIKEATS